MTKNYRETMPANRYIKSDEYELEVEREVESEKPVEKESSVIWPSRQVGAHTGGMKEGPARHLNAMDIVLIQGCSFMFKFFIVSVIPTLNLTYFSPDTGFTNRSRSRNKSILT